MKPSQPNPASKSEGKSKVQGEGDYISAEKYNRDTQEFVDAGKVEQAAKEAAPRSAQEEAEMRQAEAAGRERSKSSGKDEGKASGKPQPPQQAPGQHPQGNNPAPKKVPGR